MKAVVMSIQGDRAAVLAMDGTYYNIRNKSYRIGQSIEFESGQGTGQKLLSFTRSRAAKLTAAAAAVLILVGSFSANTFAYSTVTLDLNPSLRYDLNFFDRVIDFASYNEDGEDIVSTISSEVLGQDIDTAIEMTLNALDEADYIGEETPVIMTVDSHLFRDGRLEKKTRGEMEAWNEEQGRKHPDRSIHGESYIVDRDLKTRAHDGNMSPGKVIMLEQYPENGQEAPPLPPESGKTDTEMTERPERPSEPATELPQETETTGRPEGLSEPPTEPPQETEMTGRPERPSESATELPQGTETTGRPEKPSEPATELPQGTEMTGRPEGPSDPAPEQPQGTEMTGRPEGPSDSPPELPQGTEMTGRPEGPSDPAPEPPQDTEMNGRPQQPQDPGETPPGSNGQPPR
ncbi:MAG: hypothetical protein K6G83_03730 [Lachnospiraceae bacterium]|nr:hypothetical protein [Lachnospiraceae bacterium]